MLARMRMDVAASMCQHAWGVHVYVCMRACVCVCLWVFAFVCMNERARECQTICVDAFATRRWLRVGLDARMHVIIETWIMVGVGVLACMRVDVGVGACAHACVCIRAWVRVGGCVGVCSCIILMQTLGFDDPICGVTDFGFGSVLPLSSGEPKPDGTGDLKPVNCP